MKEKQNQSSAAVDEEWQYTRCPQCQAVFRIDQSKLVVRKGEVRCGSCRAVFHAPSNIVYRDGGSGFSSLLAKPIAKDAIPAVSREETHRAVVRAKMGLDPEPEPGMGIDSTGAYLNKNRLGQSKSAFLRPQTSVDKAIDTVSNPTDSAQAEFVAPEFDLPSNAPAGQKPSDDLALSDPNVADSPSINLEVAKSESKISEESDLASIRSAYLESFAEPKEDLIEPTFEGPDEDLVSTDELSMQPSISANSEREDVEVAASSFSGKIPIQIKDEEEQFADSILTNTVDDSSEMVELVIPKISSEPLVNRQSESAENRRSEPMISVESDMTSQVSDNSDVEPELEREDAALLPDFEAVNAAREAQVFEPLSESEQHDEPQLEVLATEGAEEQAEAVEISDESIAEIKLPELDSPGFGAQSYDAATTQMPPRFEPFIPPPSDPEPKDSSEELIDRWSVKDDSLLDHNPFAPKFDANDRQAEEMAEIKMDPRPAAINMSGVDEYIVDRPNPLAGVFWFLVSVAFVVLLGLQVKYFLVERFAQHEAYRPYLQVFCKVARCELPPRRDAYRFTITQTRVDLHPQEPGALRITVRLLNQADFSQPYPELRLTLTDRVGRVVGRRKFDPDFYLQKGSFNRLASGELGYVVFDLAHPHEKAVGFVVDVVRRSI